MMARLSIYLLGTFQVRLKDQFVTHILRTDKERLLLAYLAMEQGRSHPRAALAQLFWPDRPEPIARTNLRQALMGVRRTIGDRVATSPFLTLVEESIQFNPPYPYWIDATAFQACFQAVQNHPHAQLETCQTCMQRYHEAVTLYRGDFLSGFLPTNIPALVNWINGYREMFFRFYINALHNLTAYYRSQGRLELAMRYARQQVMMAPLEERGHRQLMSLLATDGQRSAAMQQYLALKNTLWDEVGRQPAPETEALLDRIRNGRSLETGRLDPSAPPRPKVSPFIGRQQELGRISKCMMDPDCRLLVINGSEGSGKTRLALQLANQNIDTFRDGIWFVDASSAQDANQLTGSIAQCLGLQFPGGHPIREQLFEFLAPFETLLIIDNYSDLAGQTTFLSELLQATLGVKILILCRKRCAPPVACLFDLHGLSYPQSLDDSNPIVYPAVQLFLTRARQIHQDFQLTGQDRRYAVQICQLTGGNPLAIELACSRLVDHSVQEVAQNLQQDLAKLQASLRKPTPTSQGAENSER
jgi:DNA-binding SARP family transcriptional activator